MTERDRIAEALERETFVVNDSKLRNLLHAAAVLLRSEPVGEPQGFSLWHHGAEVYRGPALTPEQAKAVMAGWEATTLPVRPVGEPWRPIETAPKDGTQVLCCMTYRAWKHEVESVGVARWTEHNGGGWVSYQPGAPTHWMPLPAPPAAPEAQEPERDSLPAWKLLDPEGNASTRWLRDKLRYAGWHVPGNIAEQDRELAAEVPPPTIHQRGWLNVAPVTVTGVPVVVPISDIEAHERIESECCLCCGRPLPTVSAAGEEENA